MSVLRKHMPWIETFHRAQGTFALLLGLSHPLLLAVSVGAKDFLAFSFVAPEQKAFVLLGFFQLFLLMLTALTAILMKLPFLVGRWHYIHYLNYLLFACVFVHSWNLGSDLASNQQLKILWCILAISAAAATIARFTRKVPVRPRASNDPGIAAVAKQRSGGEGQEYVTAASVDQLELGTPFCATVNGKPLLICRLPEGIFAMDNTCSHAGGSLCKGDLEGTVIECPRHGAKFDVRTGAVVAAPAKVPQQVYKVRIDGDKVQVEC
jgi:3-phenylpropionate/trans-cinnamate dioxygenase ferredoxin subunit